MPLLAKPFHNALLCLSSCLGLCLALGQCLAQEGGQPSEYEIKAAFLFNFAKFTEWPTDAFPDDKSPIIIGTLGGNPFGEALQRTLKGKTLNERPLIIKEFTSAEAATNSHVLFVSSTEAERMPAIMKTLAPHSVLTIGDSESFSDAGGMITFFTEANKIRFQVNDEAAKKAKLTISAKLLSLASKPKR